MATKYDGRHPEGFRWYYRRDKAGNHIKGKNGNYIKSYVFRYRDTENKDRQVTAASIEDIRAKRDKIKGDLARGTYVEPRKGETTVKEYVNAWLKAKKPLMDVRTWKTHESRIRNHVIPQLGKYRLRQLHAGILEEFQAHLADGRSLNTARQYFGTLSMIIGEALAKGEIGKDPRAGMTKIKTEWLKKKFPFTLEEVQAIEAKAGEDLRVMIQVAVGTGLRVSELIGVCEDQIDWTEGQEVLHMDRQIGQHPAYGTVLKAPKSHKGDRVIPLPKWVVEALKSYMERHPVTAHTMTRVHRDNTVETIKARLIFHAEEGAPLKYDDVRRPWDKAVKAAGIEPKGEEGTGLHRLRHTYAGDHIKAGTDLYRLSVVMGHSSVRVTEQYYAHLGREALDPLRTALDRLRDATPNRPVLKAA